MIPVCRNPENLLPRLGLSRLICFTSGPVQSTRYLSPAVHVPGGVGSSSPSIWSSCEAQFPFSSMEMKRAGLCGRDSGGDKSNPCVKKPARGGREA